MLRVASLAAVFCLAACAADPTEITTIDPDTYRISTRLGVCGYRFADEAKAALFDQAKGFCEGRHQQLEMLDLKADDGTMAAPCAIGSVEFACEPPSSP